MFRRITLTLALLAAAMSLIAQDRYVELSAKNFPDANFRSFLKSKFSSNVSNNKLDVTVVETLDFSFNNTTSKKIKSLNGINLLVNLRTLILPAKYAYDMGPVDVSGMQKLTTVTNGVKASKGSTPYYVNGEGIKTDATLKNISKNSITKFTAIDCPNLTEVNLAGYKWLKDIELGGVRSML